MRGLRGGRTAAGAVVAALLLGGAGCGIRGTSVPVDAGPAPSRASCAAPGERAASGTTADVPVRVFLVCSGRLKAVDRSARPVKGGDAGETAVRTAQVLLGELQDQPTAEEEGAGFSTEVPDGLEVAGPREGDPDGTLRLNRPPDELPSYALAQLVCTYADTPVTGAGRSVVLGGRDEEPPQRYVCDDALREDPQTAPRTGTRAG